MSLPNLTTQAPLFATLTPEFFAPEDRYRLFARRIFPLLLQARPALEKACCDGNGRPRPGTGGPGRSDRAPVSGRHS